MNIYCEGYFSGFANERPRLADIQNNYNNKNNRNNETNNE